MILELQCVIVVAQTESVVPRLNYYTVRSVASWLRGFVAPWLRGSVAHAARGFPTVHRSALLDLIRDWPLSRFPRVFLALVSRSACLDITLSAHKNS